MIHYKMSLSESKDLSEETKKKLIDFSVEFCDGIPGSLIVISDIFHLLRCSNFTSEDNEKSANLLMKNLLKRKLQGPKLWTLYKDKHNENIIETMNDILELDNYK